MEIDTGTSVFVTNNKTFEKVNRQEIIYLSDTGIKSRTFTGELITHKAYKGHKCKYFPK